LSDHSGRGTRKGEETLVREKKKVQGGEILSNGGVRVVNKKILRKEGTMKDTRK